MLEMKRVVILLSILLLTCSAPIENEPNLSEESEDPPRATEVAPQAQDIIITTPEGFGKPNEDSQSAITVLLRDENTNVSLDVVSFIFSKQDERSDEEPNRTFDGSDEKNSTNVADDASDEGFDPTPASDEELSKSGEETPNSEDHDNDDDDDDEENREVQAMDESDEKRNSSQSDSDQSNASSESVSNESQTLSKSASESLEDSEVLHHLLGDIKGLKSRLAPLNMKLLKSEETISAEDDGKGSDSRESYSKPTLGPRTASPLRSSSEEEELLVGRMTPSSVSPELMKNGQIEKKKVSPTALFSGLDLYPAYVNDEAQEVDFGPYDFGYYDPYGYQQDYDPNHYDPNHYDPNHYDPNHYDPNHYDPNHYDPNHYDPNHYDPNHYDPNHYDPNNYDPYTIYQNYYRNYYQHYYQNNYDHNNYDPNYEHNNHITSDYDTKTSHRDTYYEPDTKGPGHDPAEETSPSYSSEASENPTTTPNSQDSQSEEHPESQSISSSVTPATLPEGSLSMTTDVPSNSSSVEGPDESSEAATSDSSEESLEADQRSQNQFHHPGKTEDQDSTDQPSSSNLLQVIQAVLGSETLGENQAPNQPAGSSEEDLEPSTNAPGLATPEDADATPSTDAENDQDEESLSNESTTDAVEGHPESTPESTLDQEATTSLFSNEEASNENSTPNPSVNPSVPTQSSGATGANDSEESNEAFASPTASPTNRKVSVTRHTVKSSEEQNGKSQVATPPKRTVTNPWMTFLQALKVHVIDRGILRRSNHQLRSTRRKVNSSEED